MKEKERENIGMYWRPAKWGVLWLRSTGGENAMMLWIWNC